MPKLNIFQKALVYFFLSTSLPSLIFLSALIFITNPSSQNTFMLIVTFFAVNLFAFVSIFLLFKTKIYSPLSSLFTNMHKLVPHQTDQPASGDEITDAQTWINQVRNNLNQYSQKFQSYNLMIDAQTKELALSLSSISDPVIAIDLQYRIILFNKAASDFTGIPARDALNHPVYQLLKFYDKNKEVPVTGYAPLRPGGYDGEIFKKAEIKIISSQGKETYADVTVTQIKEGPTINLGAILTFHDTTKEKQLEAMKMDFVSMAAHELRTPLTTIKGYISVFLQENSAKLTEDQMMFLRRINTASQQLSSLVENLLSVSRVERGAMTLNLQLIDWSNDITQQVDQFEQRATEKRIDLELVKPPANLPQVRADTVRINEVLNNLISNALNYTEPGGKITVWVEQKNDFIITHVKDTGKGIPREGLQHLFTKFFRVTGGPADQASKGNGLGLYISKAIVELHHGKIWAESEGLGKGTTFSFELPIAHTEQFDLGLLTKSL